MVGTRSKIGVEIIAAICFLDGLKIRHKESYFIIHLNSREM
jgi:hypothetical protein